MNEIDDCVKTKLIAFVGDKLSCLDIKTGSKIEGWIEQALTNIMIGSEIGQALLDFDHSYHSLRLRMNSINTEIGDPFLIGKGHVLMLECLSNGEALFVRTLEVLERTGSHSSEEIRGLIVDLKAQALMQNCVNIQQRVRGFGSNRLGAAMPWFSQAAKEKSVEEYLYGKRKRSGLLD